jgi:hypothetical protein
MQIEGHNLKEPCLEGRGVIPKKSGNTFCHDCHRHGHGMNHLGETIDYHKDGVISLAIWQLRDEVCGNDLPWMSGDFRWC